jgi:FkbM family methyltransferase
MIKTVELGWRFGTIELPAQDRYIRPAIEITGEYSGGEIDLYQALLNPGDTALDVGANIGVFSIAMGLAVGETGKVIAFEPQPPIFDILRRNIDRCGLAHVEAQRVIVAERDGDGAFVGVTHLPDGKQLNFGAINVDSRVRDGFGDLVPTPMRTIDSLDLERCDFIKIDVEGGEPAVLEGASATLARLRPILCLECDQPNAVSPWVDDLLAADYRLWRFRGRNMRIPNPKGVTTGLSDISIIMVLAIPAENLKNIDEKDLADLRPITSRAELEKFSRHITRAALQ